MNTPTKGGVYLERQESVPPARFLTLPKQDKVASKKEGRPIFKDTAYIEILKERGAILTFEVNDEYKARYPAQWEAFQKQQEQVMEGTPLEQWPGCTRSECENLKHAHIFTVEQLAEANDASLEGYGRGHRELQDKARKYLSAAQDGGVASERMIKLESDNAALKESNEELKKVLEDMRSELDSINNGRVDPVKTIKADTSYIGQKDTNDNDITDDS